MSVRGEDLVARAREFARTELRPVGMRYEESEEFPRVLAALDADERHKLGERLLAVEKLAPTHPHPAAAGSTTAQVLTGPFAAMVDRVRDAMSR